MKSFTLFLSFFIVSSAIFAQRSNLCDRPILADRLPAFLNIPQYFDYVQAKQCQATSKKPLFIYFTARLSANAKKLEQALAGDSAVMRLLNHFIIVTLYVDDEQVGGKNLLLEEQKYSCKTQPQYIIESFQDKWQGMIGDVSKETFINFVQANVPK